MNWNDLHVFVEIARQGSTLGASKALKMTQSTVSRRIQVLEDRCGYKLFERDTRGYKLTSNGHELLKIAHEIEQNAIRFRTIAERLGRQKEELIRVTASSEALSKWGIEILNAFTKAHPELSIEMDTNDRLVSLEDGEADVAIRATDTIDSDKLVARRVGRPAWALYASRGYEKELGLPRSFEEAKAHNYIRYSTDIAKGIAPVRMIDEALNLAKALVTVRSVTGMLASLQTGSGIGALPCVVGDQVADLVPCFRDEKLKHTVWVVCSRSAYEKPVVREMVKFIADRFPAEA